MGLLNWIERIGKILKISWETKDPGDLKLCGIQECTNKCRLIFFSLC